MRILPPLFSLALTAVAGYLAWSQMRGLMEAWAHYLPDSPRLLAGYRTDTDATLEIAGLAADGVDRHWAFILEKPEGESWRIQTYWDSGQHGIRWE